MPSFMIEKTDGEGKQSIRLDRQLRTRVKASFVYQLKKQGSCF